MTIAAHRPPSIFESYNARNLRPDEVARTFIPPSQYDELIARSNSVLIGPRGSGKTTLFKMLQEPALEAWRHERADEIRERIDFTGVFIPTDRIWSAQVERVGESLEPRYQQLVGNAAFTAHVLRALVLAMEYRAHAPLRDWLTPHRRVELPTEVEAEIVAETAVAWHIPTPVKSLRGLRHAMTDRLQRLLTLASVEATRPRQRRDERLADEPILHLDFLAASVPLLERFNDATGEADGLWAFLFDELELAPGPIRTLLLRALRSGDQRMLFKLSLAPYVEDASDFHDALSARAMHDYTPIVLTYPNKEDGYGFCRSLFSAMLAARDLEAVSPEELLGVSIFERSRRGERYASGGFVQRRIRLLAESDATFAAYLGERGIDPDNPDALSGRDRAKDLRKVVSIVILRGELRNPDDRAEATGRATRSRKNAEVLYTGVPALFALVEGNPRLFIGMMNGILDGFEVRGAVTPRMQAREIQRAIRWLRSLLRAIPVGDQRVKLQAGGLLPLLDPIGEYFHRCLVLKPFTPDPPATFTVPENLELELLDDLKLALNAGAIIHVPDERVDDDMLLTLVGKRFRLAYLLAPHYRTLLTLGREVSLNTILDRRGDETGRGLIEHQEQIDLDGAV